MFFFKRKRLIEIEEKIDRLLQMMEKQMQETAAYEKNSRQFVEELLTEKMEFLTKENKSRVEAIEAKLQKAEANLAMLAEQNLDEIRQMDKIWKQSDKLREKTLKDIRKTMDEAQRMREEMSDKLEKQIQETADKVELVENEIRMLLLNSVMDQMDQQGIS